MWGGKQVEERREERKRALEKRYGSGVVCGVATHIHTCAFWLADCSLIPY